MGSVRDLRSRLKELGGQVDKLTRRDLVVITLDKGETEEGALDRYCEETGESIELVRRSELIVFINYSTGS